LQVDPERMARVAAIITGVGQTWLYTGLGCPPPPPLVLSGHAASLTPY
jgi:hypothetical protein